MTSDAEALSVVFEICQEIPWIRDKTFSIILGHTNFLDAVLLHFAVDEKYHSDVKNILTEIKAGVILFYLHLSCVLDFIYIAGMSCLIGKPTCCLQ